MLNKLLVSFQMQFQRNCETDKKDKLLKNQRLLVSFTILHLKSFKHEHIFIYVYPISSKYTLH